MKVEGSNQLFCLKQRIYLYFEKCWPQFVITQPIDFLDFIKSTGLKVTKKSVCLPQQVQEDLPWHSANHQSNHRSPCTAEFQHFSS